MLDATIMFVSRAQYLEFREKTQSHDKGAVDCGHD